MANTTIKISQLPSIGNATTANTLLPVVNTSGALTTQKVTVGNVANFTLNEAGNLLPPAFLSTYALNIINANQPNITSTGTLSNISINDIANLNIPGGVGGDFIATDGNGHLFWTSVFGSLVNYNGNIGNLSFAQANNSVLLGGTSSYVKLATGDTRLADDLNDVEIWSAGNVFVFDAAGTFTAPHGIVASGNVNGANMLISNEGNIGMLTVRQPGQTPNVRIANGAIVMSNSLSVGSTITAFGNIRSNANVVAQANIVATDRLITTNGVFYSNGIPFAGSAGGSNTEVQFNDAGALGGSADFTFDRVTGNLNVSNGITTGSLSSNGSLEGQNIYANGDLYVYDTSYLGNLVPRADTTYTLGNATTQWSNLHISNVITNHTDPLQLVNAQGNVIITSGAESWSFTTEGNGNTYLPPNSYITTAYGSMYVQSKGDYYIYGYNQPDGIDNQGGRIQLYSGNGSNASANASGGDGGYIRLYAGQGGESTIDNTGGDGGYVRILAGIGGNANNGNSIVARDGGNIEIVAGDSGYNDGNILLGAHGGNVLITAGNTTYDSGFGGNIVLTPGVNSNGPKGTIRLNGIVHLENSIEIDNSLPGILYVGGANVTLTIIDDGPGSGFNITTNESVDPHTWEFDNTGGFSTPNNLNSVTYTKGAVTLVQGDPFPASAPQQTTQTVYTASSWDVIGAKVNLRVQGTNFTELLEIQIAKEYSNANVGFSVYNRLKTNSLISDTVISASLDGSNNIIVTANCQALGYSYYTYDVTEFRYTYD